MLKFYCFVLFLHKLGTRILRFCVEINGRFISQTKTSVKPYLLKTNKKKPYLQLFNLNKNLHLC